MTRYTSVPDVLRHAAERAESERGLTAAVSTAWRSLHIEPALMPACFDAWRAAENFTSHASQLGGVLLRRHRTPADIAGSLRRAASQAETAEQPGGTT